MTSPYREQQAVRVIVASFAKRFLSEQLFGRGVVVSSCEVVCRHMLPSSGEAVITAVLDHGLSLTFEEVADDGDLDQTGGVEARPPRALMVPWAQVAYVRHFG